MDAKDDRARVLIVDPATGEVIAQCHGAGDMGDCPQAAEGAVIPCAGCRVVPVDGTGLEGWVMTVQHDAAGGCPLAFLPVRDVA